MVRHQPVEGILPAGERFEGVWRDHCLEIAMQMLVRPLGGHGGTHLLSSSDFEGHLPFVRS